MQISHIIKKYDEKTVVNDVSFSLPKGKVTSLIGPNGAGKSTVMSIISRLIAPDNGSVVIEKKDITKRIPNNIITIFFFIKLSLPIFCIPIQ